MSANQKSDVHNQADVRSQANIEAQNAKQNAPQVSQAPGNPIRPSSEPVIQSGGRGIVGGKYGVQITTGHENAYGESQGRQNVSERFQQQTGGNSQDYNSMAAEYAKSLVVNRGLAPNSNEFNTAFQNYLQANRLEQAKQESTSRQESAKPIGYDENYGYSGGVKVSPIITQNFVKNPLETNFDLSKDKLATQYRRQSRDLFNEKPTVETPQSIGKSFGYAWASGQREMIGAKIFSGQTQLIRGSATEEAAKKAAEVKASQIYPTFAKGNPLRDTTVGGPIKSGTIVKSPDVLSGLIDKNAQKNQMDLFRSLNKENQPLSEGQIALGNGLIGLSNQQIEEKNASIALGNGLISLSNQQILEKNQSTALGNALISLSNKQIAGKNIAQEKQIQDVFRQGVKENAIFYLYDKNNNLVSKTSGTRAFHDYLKAEKSFGPISIEKSYTISSGISQHLTEVGKQPLMTPLSVNPYGQFGEALAFPFRFVKAGGQAIVSGTVSTLSGLYSTGKLFVNKSQGNPQTLLTQPTSELSRGIVHSFVPIHISEFVKSGRIVNAREPQTKSAEAINKQFEFNPKTQVESIGSDIAQVGMLASGIYGLKGFVPLRVTRIPLPVKEGTPIYGGITLGYEGSRAKYLIGKVGKEIILGQPKAQQLKLSELAPTTTRYGYETGAGKPVVNRIITGTVVPELERQGKLSKTGALDITETGKQALPLATKAPTIVQREGFGEKPIRTLTPTENVVLFNLVKKAKFTLTGSASEIPFTKEGLVSAARDIDIKGVKPKKAAQFNVQAAKALNDIAVPGRTFTAEGEKLFLNVQAGGIVNQEKIVEFPQKDALEGSPGLSPDYVFGIKTPTGTNKIKGIKLVEYNYQGMRKTASSTEFHIKPNGEIEVRAASGREVKDPAHVYSFLKTKAANYFAVGKIKEGSQLDIFAENYRARHPELDFSKEFTGVGGVTLQYEGKSFPSLFTYGSKSAREIISKTPPFFSLNTQNNDYYRIKSKTDLIESPYISKFSRSSPSSKIIGTSYSSTIKYPQGKSIYNISSNLSKISSIVSLSPKSGYTRASKSSPTLSGLSKRLGKLTSPNPQYPGSPGSPKSPGRGRPSYPGSPTSPSRGGTPLPPGSPKSPGRGTPFNPTIPTNPSKIIPILKFGAFPKRPRYRPKEGPTRTYLYGVQNIFASSLSLKAGK